MPSFRFDEGSESIPPDQKERRIAIGWHEETTLGEFLENTVPNLPESASDIKAIGRNIQERMLETRQDFFSNTPLSGEGVDTLIRFGVLTKEEFEAMAKGFMFLRFQEQLQIFYQNIRNGNVLRTLLQKSQEQVLETVIPKLMELLLVFKLLNPDAAFSSPKEQYEVLSKLKDEYEEADSRAAFAGWSSFQKTEFPRVLDALIADLEMDFFKEEAAFSGAFGAEEESWLTFPEFPEFENQFQASELEATPLTPQAAELPQQETGAKIIMSDEVVLRDSPTAIPQLREIHEKHELRERRKRKKKPRQLHLFPITPIRKPKTITDNDRRVAEQLGISPYGLQRAMRSRVVRKHVEATCSDINPREPTTITDNEQYIADSFNMTPGEVLAIMRGRAMRSFTQRKILGAKPRQLRIPWREKRQ